MTKKVLFINLSDIVCRVLFIKPVTVLCMDKMTGFFFVAAKIDL